MTVAAIENPINSKTQTVKMVIQDKRAFDVVINIIKYHAEAVSSVTMSRRTASEISGKFYPARPPSLPNPFNNRMEISEQDIAIDDSFDAGIVQINYDRNFAYDDSEIRRKIKAYTSAKVSH